MNDSPLFATPIAELLPSSLWPEELLPNESLEDLFAKVYFTNYELFSVENGLGFELDIFILGEISIQIPGLQDIAFVIGSGAGEGRTGFRLSMFVGDGAFELRMDDIEVALRFPPSILKPAPETDGNPAPRFAEISVIGSVALDKNLDLRIEGFDQLSLAPSMIGNSGIIISAENVRLDLSRTETIPEVLDAGFDESFVGIFIGEANIQLPEGMQSFVPEDISLGNAAIGSGGVTGAINLTYSPESDLEQRKFTGRGAGELFGIPFGLEEFALKVRQNAFQEAHMRGKMFFPFFDFKDEEGKHDPITIEIGFNLSGEFTARLSDEDSLRTFTLPNILEIEVESLGVELKDGIFKVVLSGQITPLFLKDQLDWPSFEVRELSIDSEGNVQLEGGWLNLPRQYSFDFHAFEFNITKFGLGKTDDGRKWIGFSGGLNLVEGLTAGASVEGLRIIWDDDGDVSLTLEGVGVEFEIPNVLSFKGAVSYRELPGNVHRFDGDISLELTYLNMAVDGKLVIGNADGYTFFAIYLGVQLPAGIPLGATGLAIYGFAGLFALQMEPDKRPDEEWFEGWYKRPEVGVLDLRNKWVNRRGSFALGVGTTIGTIFDTGFSFSGGLLLAIIFPGPIVMLEGKADIIRRRKGFSDEGSYRALAVLDNRAGTFLIGLDAHYKQLLSGELIDIHAGAEAFFDFNDASRWHIYLGEREPLEKRIRAEIFRLFRANAYFMLDARAVAMGAWLGINEAWRFGPLSVVLEAWLEGNVSLSWKPLHFHGDLWLHGMVELKVWRFGAGMMMDTQYACDVFKPFHILARFRVGIKLPWPLPDFKVTVKIEWGPRKHPPPLPLPLKEISIEHFKSTVTWPLPRKSVEGWPALLRPDYDPDSDDFLPVSFAQQDLSNEPPPLKLPVVPIDARPHITFGRPVHDDAEDLSGNLSSVGINPQVPVPQWERIGDPDKNEGPVRVKYRLVKVSLDIWNEEEWVTVAKSPREGDLPKIWGSWDPTPGTEGSPTNAKLWLWSNTPFNYTRFAGREWEEWFTGEFENYPCLPIPEDEELCFDFEEVDPNEILISPWAHPENPEVLFFWESPEALQITTLETPVFDKTQALCTESDMQIAVRLPEAAQQVRIAIWIEGGSVSLKGFTDPLPNTGDVIGPVEIQKSKKDPENLKSLILPGKDINTAVITVKEGRVCIMEICYTIGLTAEERLLRQEMLRHIEGEVARFSQAGHILRPDSTYRLKIGTQAEQQGMFEGAPSPIEYAYFRTEGPPGLTHLSEPIGYPPDPDAIEEEGSGATDEMSTEQTVETGLEDLTRYVEQTIPATVPQPGATSFLPRPVYRAYDIGVRFNEDYVDLMYRISRRDLGLYLYDNSNQPVRDAEGRLIVLNNLWGAVEELSLHAGESRYISIFNANDCWGSSINPEEIPHNKALSSAHEGQVLQADTVYEARLIPLLLHDDFNHHDRIGETPPDWEIIEEDDSEAPSTWQVAEGGDEEVRIYSVRHDAIAGASPGIGSFSLTGEDIWSNYRLTVMLRSENEGAIGVSFRHSDSEHYYLFLMNRTGRYRRLMKRDGENTICLREDDFVYQQNRDYLITIEAIGNHFRVYFDGLLIFDVIDNDAFSNGRIGLYCWKDTGGMFQDVRVDDFQENAPIVYKFEFTASLFANFFHHLHSFQDETWPKPLGAAPNDNDIGVIVDTAVSPEEPVTEEEAQNFERLEELLFDPQATQLPQQVEVTRASRNEDNLMFYVKSPEPLDWSRVEIGLSHTEHLMESSSVPGSAKLTHAELHTVENQVLLNETFEYPDLLDVNLGQGAELPDGWELVDETDEHGPSDWRIASEEAGGESKYYLIQNSNIYGGVFTNTADPRPGTILFMGDDSWTDCRLWVRLQSDDDDTIGICFRCFSNEHYYMFSMDREKGYRRLSVRWGTYAFTLFQDYEAYEEGKEYDIRIDVIGFRIRIEIDEITWIDTLVPYFPPFLRIPEGRVGLYCWANKGARFNEVKVLSLINNPALDPNYNKEYIDLLLRESLNPSSYRLETLALPGVPKLPTGNDLLFEDNFETENLGVLFEERFGPFSLDKYEIIYLGEKPEDSTWEIPDSETWIRHHSPTTRGCLFGLGWLLELILGKRDTPETFAILRDSNWTNYRLRVKLRLEVGNTMGAVFRYQNESNFYRFTMNARSGEKKLSKIVAGEEEVLRTAEGGFQAGKTYRISIEVFGDELIVFLDAHFLFHVTDSQHPHGRVGLFCDDINAGFFEFIVVEALEEPPVLWFPETMSLNDFQVIDEGANEAPSNWELEDGVIRQTSNIWGESEVETELPGTIAITGSGDWNDYLLSLRLSTSTTSEDLEEDRRIGVVFRFKDQNNYYRFSISGSDYSLVARIDGEQTQLWSELGLEVDLSEQNELTVSVIGKEIKVFLNGQELISVFDNNLKSGMVGLYCWKNSGAQFERMIVLNRTRRLGPWRIFDAGEENRPSRWRISHGDLIQTGVITGESSLVDGDDGTHVGAFAYLARPEWRNYRFQTTLRSDKEGVIGVMFRYVDEQNYYRFSFGDRRRLERAFEGNLHLIWEDEENLALGETHVLSIDVIENRARVFIDGEVIDETFDLQHDEIGLVENGGIALYCSNNDGARFERVRIKQLPVEALAMYRDRFSENDFSEWELTENADLGAAPEWSIDNGELVHGSNELDGDFDSESPEKLGTMLITGSEDWDNYIVIVKLASYDDDAIGVVFRFQNSDNLNFYRFSMDHQKGYRRLIKNRDDIVTTLWEDEIEYEIGRTYEVAITLNGNHLSVFADNVPVCSVVDNEDPITNGQIGLYCWANNDARFGEVKVYPISVLPANPLFRQFFIQQNLSRWSIPEAETDNWVLHDRELVQESEMGEGPDDCDSIEKLGPLITLKDLDVFDFRLVVKLNSGTNAAIGVVFRYQDNDNYYRFSMDQSCQYRRLLKKVGGNFERLNTDVEEGHEVGRDHLLTVDFLGNQICIYLDGVEVFNVTDSDLTHGSIGLYCWKNPDARFSEVTVWPAGFVNYYTFDIEKTLPAGTRFRVHSGSIGASTEEEPGIKHRYVLELDDPGRWRFPVKSTQIRYLDHLNNNLHDRTFLAKELYNKRDFLILRNRDSTKFFLILPNETPARTLLPKGEYRLHLTYRKDNKLQDPESLVYSEVGLTNEEVVTIDIPW